MRVVVATLLLLGVCFAARLQPTTQADSQSLHPDWITPEDKSMAVHAPSAEQSEVESPASLLETQARAKAESQAKAGEGGDAPSWILPLAPAGYGGPGVINPYSNVNPLNPMAAQMQAEAAGQFKAGTPQTQMGPAQNNNAPVQPSFLEVETKTGEKRTMRPVIESAEIRVPWNAGAAFAPPPFMPFGGAAMERGLPTSLRLPFPVAGMFPMPISGAKGPVMERMDISFTVPHSSEDFNWPVVNGVVREHIEITRVPSQSQDDSESSSEPALGSNMLTGLLRELSGSSSQPAKLEVVELPSNASPLDGILQTIPALFGGGAFTVEPEMRDESDSEEGQERQPAESAEHEPAPTAAAESSEEVISASPTEQMSSESPAELPATETSAPSEEGSSSSSSHDQLTEPIPQLDLPPQLESETSALLNALLQSKIDEAVAEVNQELESTTPAADGANPTTPAADGANPTSGALKSKP